MPYYRDLRDHIKTLEESGKLVRINRPINKDTELMPLVRWQFNGLPASERKAFLFENIFDAKNKKYDMPVLVASHAASKEMYAIGMKCTPDAIAATWEQAQMHPIEPKLVAFGPVHENVHIGDDLVKWGGLGRLPVPISTPGFDNAPYISAGNWVTKDPDTGIRNVGIYRSMIKSDLRAGIFNGPNQHLRLHWEKCRNRGLPLQAAIVIGATPNLCYLGGAKIPVAIDEYSIAGGIAREPMELVRCKTVNVEVPATAELVIEGEVPVDYLEREAPFGEFTGYMGGQAVGLCFNVTCITHRNNAIFNAILGQIAPSEENTMKAAAACANWLQFLKNDLNIPGILACSFHENGGSSAFLVVQLKKVHTASVWQALYGAATRAQSWPKIVIAVDDDIDPNDADAVNWALSFRIQPHRDVRVIHGKTFALDPSGAPPTASHEDRAYPPPDGGSCLLIDATRKWGYPPVSLPKKEYMEKAREIWEQEGLPQLNVKAPWYGYSLGSWTDEDETEAQLAIQGDHYITGEKLARQRIKL